MTDPMPLHLRFAGRMRYRAIGYDSGHSRDLRWSRQLHAVARACNDTEPVDAAAIMALVDEHCTDPDLDGHVRRELAALVAEEPR